MTWQDRAACKGLTTLFYTDKGGTAEHAKAVCATCPVAEPCREQGITDREQFGVWGGLTAKDIIVERRKRRLGGRAA